MIKEQWKQKIADLADRVLFKSTYKQEEFLLLSKLLGYKNEIPSHHDMCLRVNSILNKKVRSNNNVYENLSDIETCIHYS